MRMHSFRIGLILGLGLTLGCVADDDTTDEAFRSCEGLVGQAEAAETAELPGFTAQMADESCYDAGLQDDLTQQLTVELEQAGLTERATDLVHSIDNLQSVAPSDVVFRESHHEVGCSGNGESEGAVCIIAINGGGECDPPVEVNGVIYIVCGGKK